MSPSSNTNGTRRNPPTSQPATAEKNCGEVAATTSGRGSRQAAIAPIVMKLRKSRVLSTVPRLGAMKLLTRTTRMPSIVSV